MRLYTDRTSHCNYEEELLEAGRELLKRIPFNKRYQREEYQLAGIVNASLNDQKMGPLAAEITVRMMQAFADNSSYSYNYDFLLAALLKVQPEVVLDALFESDDVDERESLSMFDCMDDLRGNPASTISEDVLIVWCEKDPQRHYSLMASIVTFAKKLEADDVPAWSSQAVALLTNAPDPQNVLALFIKRFRPMSWSGSRATIMEKNAQLLDNIDTFVPSSLMPFVAESKLELLQAIEKEREQETWEDRETDERFED